jgi:hypothetical protein
MSCFIVFINSFVDFFNFSIIPTIEFFKPSNIANLLLKLFEYDKNKVTLNNADLNHSNLQSIENLDIKDSLYNFKGFKHQDNSPDQINQSGTSGSRVFFNINYDENTQEFDFVTPTQSNSNVSSSSSDNENSNAPGAPIISNLSTPETMSPLFQSVENLANRMVQDFGAQSQYNSSSRALASLYPHYLDNSNRNSTYSGYYTEDSMFTNDTNHAVINSTLPSVRPTESFYPYQHIPIPGYVPYHHDIPLSPLPDFRIGSSNTSTVLGITSDQEAY